MDSSPSRQQTRGRPKKIVTLMPSRDIFSQHCAVFYACCMVYVLEIFINTKQQKRVGHSEGGFTLYQKINEQYCFENVQQYCRQWRLQHVIKNQSIINFLQIINGSAPKIVFKELVFLIQEIIGFITTQKIEQFEKLESQYLLPNLSENQLNRKYKYIRFSYSALKQLKMQKFHTEVSSKIKQLWRPFVSIISYSVYYILNNQDKNRYFKPFFSDAQNPQDTLIGQLNLKQILNFKEQRTQQKDISQNAMAKLLQIKSQPEVQESKCKKSEQNSRDKSQQFLNKRQVMLIKIPKGKDDFDENMEIVTKNEKKHEINTQVGKIDKQILSSYSSLKMLISQPQIGFNQSLKQMNEKGKKKVKLN